MKKSIIAFAAIAIVAAAHAYPSTEAVAQPAEITAYAKCQLAMPEFDSFDYHVHKDAPAFNACMQLSDKITREHFNADPAAFQTWYRDNALAIVMEVKPDYN